MWKWIERRIGWAVPLTIVEQKRAAWAAVPGSRTPKAARCESALGVRGRLRALWPLFDRIAATAAGARRAAGVRDV